MRGATKLLAAGIALVTLAVPLRAQDPAADLAAATELERQGRAQEAADRFARVLDASPAHIVALFGLERTLQASGGLDRFLPYVEHALEQKPDDPAIRGLELRALGALGRDDDVLKAVQRWIAAAPGTADPYREWAFLVAQHGDLAGAREVLERGRAAVGGDALIPELAQISAALGDWVAATRYWYAAVQSDAAYASAAGMSLAQVRLEDQASVLHTLLAEFGDATARRIAADALVGWGRPAEGWTLLGANLPNAGPDAQTVVRRFAERVRLLRTPEASHVRGLVYERLASLEAGPAAQRSRIEAARAFAEAGDRPAAERMLTDIAKDPTSAPPGTVEAMTDLIALLADAGRPADAERRLREWEPRLTEGVRQELGRHIAWAWARTGELDRADSAIGNDSAVAALAVKGWIALFRGQLTDAVALFRAAGPYAGSRDEATDRTTVAALAQRANVERAPELGTAFLALERGDTAGAVSHFERAATELSADHGRSDVLAFAGRLALDCKDERAAHLFTSALASDSTGPAAPTAELGLAELAWRAGRADEARTRLEHLILGHPESALVPQARRLLDRVRGAIPSS
jgi:tetratricopeptide (TPR) repeat protein